MDKREATLQEAIEKNKDDKLRWENYSKEQEIAITNLDCFSKKLNLNIMVPIGRKAFMPGRLIHTNEVLVGHFQDYFSKCSSHTATEICKQRLEKAKQYRDKLEAEREFFENKLKKPHLDGILPSTEQLEITEEYDEEKERIWREIHKQKVKEAKLKEKQERESAQAQSKSIEEIKEILDEEAVMDELNEELEEHNMEANRETQEILSKLMSGEINLQSPKRRIAHNRTDNYEISKKEKANEAGATNVLNSKSEQIENPNENSMNIEYYGEDSDMNTQKYMLLIQKQAEYLPKNERAPFFLCEMEIIDAKIAAIHAEDEEAIKEKTRLLGIRYHLEELFELNEDVPEADLDMGEVEEYTSLDPKSQRQKKRRISFAIEDQMLEFRKNETVAQMMPTNSPTEEKLPRDIIQLDDSVVNISSNPLQNPCILESIAEKIEENLKTQSTSGTCIVNTILKSSSVPQTLHINFRHSTQIPQLTSGSKSDIPQSPADLYELYQQQSQSKPDAEKFVEVDTKEKPRENVFVDLISEVMAKENTAPENQSKPILKKKSSMELKQHIRDNKMKSAPQKKYVRKPKEDDDYLSAYNKVMGEVIESKITQPDPLPQGKFIDMHTPKKRISRFKQMRNVNQ